MVDVQRSETMDSSYMYATKGHFFGRCLANRVCVHVRHTLEVIPGVYTEHTTQRWCDSSLNLYMLQ